MMSNIIEFLKDRDNFYLENNKELEVNDIGEFLAENIILYKLEEIIFYEELSRKDAIENILSSLKIDGVNFIYLVIGNEDGVDFYFGISKDLYYDKELSLKIEDIGDLILKANLKGFFLNIKIRDLSLEEKNKIYEEIDNMDFFSILAGAAGINEDNKISQYTDKLVNIMDGDKFGFMVIAKPLNINYISDIENNLNKLYTEISVLAQTTSTESTTKTYGSSRSKTAGESSTNVRNTSISILTSISETTGGDSGSGITTMNGNSETEQISGNSSPRTNNRLNMTENNRNISPTTTDRSGATQNSRNSPSNRSVTISESRQENRNLGESWSKTTGTTDVKLGGYSRSNTTNSAITDVNSSSDGKTTSTTLDYVNKEVSNWIKYIDEVLYKRLDYGKGRGLFNASTFLFSSNEIVIKKLENIIRLLFAGSVGNRVPMKSITLTNDNKCIEIYKRFQLPQGNFFKDGYIDNPIARSALSQYLNDSGNMMFGNWISTNELSLIAGLPQKNN